MQGFRFFACKQVYVVIAARGTAKDWSMWVEGSGCNGYSSILLEEAGVWFEAREFVAIEVEYLDSVLGSATIPGC